MYTDKGLYIRNYIVIQKSSEKIHEQLKGFITNAGYKNPTRLQSRVLPLTLQDKDIIVEAGQGEGRTGLFLISLLMRIDTVGEGIKALILTASHGEVKKIIRQYSKFAPRANGTPRLVGLLGTGDSIGKERELLARNPDIVAGTAARIIDHIRRENLPLAEVRNTVVVLPKDPEAAGFDKDALFIFSKLPAKIQIQAYCPRLDTSTAVSTIFKRPVQVPKSDWDQQEENDSMAKSNRNSDAANFIRAALKKIRVDENPDELNEFRRIYRRQIPLHLRAYFAAYLLKNALGSSSEGTGSFATLFVSVGKNRRVFPKDLSRLFSQQLNIPVSAIGSIKILDSYSFIEIPEAYAQKAIDTLNDTEFRGRNITVNFSRKNG